MSKYMKQLEQDVGMSRVREATIAGVKKFMQLSQGERLHSIRGIMQDSIFLGAVGKAFDRWRKDNPKTAPRKLYAIVCAYLIATHRIDDTEMEDGK